MPGSGIVSELEVISSKSISNICWIWSFGQLFGLAVPMSSLHSALIGKSTGMGDLGIIPNWSGQFFCKVGFFFFPPITFPEYPPSKNPNFQFFPPSPNPKLQIPPQSQKSKFPIFFPKSKSEVAEYPPHNPNFQLFPKSKSEVAEYPPNPNFQLFP